MVVNCFVAMLAIAVLIVLEYPLVVGYLFAPRQKRLSHCAKYEQRGARTILKLFHVFNGFTVEIRNSSQLEIPQHCLVIANHQSLLDIFVLMAMLGFERKPRFVAKHELSFGIPFVSFTLRKGGHCLVKRQGAPLEAMEEVAKMAVRCAHENACPVIFPEGTRSRDGKVGVSIPRE